MDAQALSAEQAAMWNGGAGHAWVDGQAMLDAMFRGFEPLMVAGAGSAARVLDVGCGTGSTTLALAHTRPAGGHCTGLDISEPMITVARGRVGGAPVDFVCDDAENHGFAPGSFDAVVSRFGVMFFGDPVRAFANLRSALHPGGGLCAFAWRSREENDFMTVADRAAAPFLEPAPQRDPHAPGQFAFADPDHVRCILDASGWSGVELQPVDVACSFPATALDLYVTRLGVLGRVLETMDPAEQAPIVTAVRAAFAPYVEADTVRFVSACWRITARA